MEIIETRPFQMNKQLRPIGFYIAKKCHFSSDWSLYKGYWPFPIGYLLDFDKIIINYYKGSEKDGELIEETTGSKVKIYKHIGRF